GDQSSLELALTGSPGGGTFYLHLFDNQSLFPVAYHLSATAAPFVVTSVSPDRGSNRLAGQIPPLPNYGPGSFVSGNLKVAGRVIPSTMTVSGAGFTQDTVVEFIAADGQVHAPIKTHFVSTRTLTLDLDQSAWPAGVYDVRITRGSTVSTRPGAFTVVQ